MREVHHVDKTIRFSYSPNQEVRRIGIVLQASMHLARNNLLQLWCCHVEHIVSVCNL